MSDFYSILSRKLQECRLMYNQTRAVYHNISAQCLARSSFYWWNFWIHRDMGRGPRVREIDLFTIRLQFGSNLGTRHDFSCPQIQSSLCTKYGAPCHVPIIGLGLLYDLAVWASANYSVFPSTNRSIKQLLFSPLHLWLPASDALERLPSRMVGVCWGPGRPHSLVPANPELEIMLSLLKKLLPLLAVMWLWSGYLDWNRK